MNWDEAKGGFAVYQTAGGLSAKTITNRAECLDILAKRAGKQPSEITLNDLLEALSRGNARTGQPLAAGTKQSERSYLQSFFRWLQAEGIREDDPSYRLPKVKVPRRKARPFRQAQLDRMLDGGSYRRTRDIITIAALTGLRIGEIVKIRGEDIDADAGTLYSLRKGHLEHAVPLGPEMLELARTYPSRGWWFPSPYPNRQFPAGDGHILMKSASTRVSYAIRQAGINDRRLTGHSLRHFYGTQLLNNGVNIRVVQEMLGHASLATTQLYTEVTDEQMHAAVQLLPRIERREHAARLPRLAA